MSAFRWPGWRIFWPRNDLVSLLRWRCHCSRCPVVWPVWYYCRGSLLRFLHHGLTCIRTGVHMEIAENNRRKLIDRRSRAGNGSLTMANGPMTHWNNDSWPIAHDPWPMSEDDSNQVHNVMLYEWSKQSSCYDVSVLKYKQMTAYSAVSDDWQ